MKTGPYNMWKELQNKDKESIHQAKFHLSFTQRYIVA